MVLEGALVTIACIALTVAHPGMVFREGWITSKTRSQTSSEQNITAKEQAVEMNARPI